MPDEEVPHDHDCGCPECRHAPKATMATGSDETRPAGAIRHGAAGPSLEEAHAIIDAFAARDRSEPGAGLSSEEAQAIIDAYAAIDAAGQLLEPAEGAKREEPSEPGDLWHQADLERAVAGMGVGDDSSLQLAMARIKEISVMASSGAERDRPSGIQDFAFLAHRWLEDVLVDPQDPYSDDVTRLRDDAPRWVVDLARRAHKDMPPDDFRYGVIEAALEYIHLHGVEKGVDDFVYSSGDDDPVALRAQELVYGSNDSMLGLLEWVSSHPSRIDYCPKTTGRFRSRPKPPTEVDLRNGRFAEIREIYDLVLGSLAWRAAEGGVHSDENDRAKDA